MDMDVPRRMEMIGQRMERGNLKKSCDRAGMMTWQIIVMTWHALELAFG